MPPSCYIIRMIIRNERWDLISECQPKKLGELVTYILTDEYIYTHPKLRKLIQVDRKGYVDIAHLCKEDSLIQYFHVNQVPATQQIAIIRYVIPLYCQQLIMRGSRVRRQRPFNTALFATIKPLCIERLEGPLTISDIRHYLGETAFSEIQHFEPTSDETLYVYAPDYRHKRQGPMPFRVVQYQKLCAERERESRYWEQQQKRFYATTSIQSKPQSYNSKEDYRFRLKGCIEEEMMTEERELVSSMQNMSSIIYKPNPVLNQLLIPYIDKMKNILDQQ